MKIRPLFRSGKLLAASALVAVCPASALMAQVADSVAQGADSVGQGADSEPQSITLSESTHLTVALADSLDSSTARAGQEFGVLLTEPLTDVWGTLAAPAGTPATGRVLNVEKKGLVAREARLMITLREIRIGGQTYPIRTNSMTIEGGRDGWIEPLNVQLHAGRTFLFTLVEPLTIPVGP